MQTSTSEDDRPMDGVCACMHVSIQLTSVGEDILRIQALMAFMHMYLDRFLSTSTIPTPRRSVKDTYLFLQTRWVNFQ